MKRKIITINEELCTGCGTCVTGCAEGALAIVDGVAKLMREDFCDGLGACIGDCPTGALQIEEREAPAFDMPKVHQASAERHNHTHTHGHGGCPASQPRVIARAGQNANVSATIDGGPAQVLPSDLAQWPVMLHLVTPHAPYFQGRELVVMSSCSPVATPDVHWRFMRGRSVVIACPKLDDTSGYAEKIAAIIAHNSIKRVIVVTMEVPCCSGLCAIVREAVGTLAKEKLPIVDECVIGLDGAYQGSRRAAVGGADK